LDRGAASDEELADRRLRLHGRRAEGAVVGRDVAPAEERLALLADRLLEDTHTGFAGGLARGQEHHADAVLARRRERDAEGVRLAREELVRDLHQDPGAVARVRLAAT